MGGPGRAFALASALVATSLLAGLLLLGAAGPRGDAPAVAPTALLYDREDACVPTCVSTGASDGFSVRAGMREIHLVVYAVLDAASGPARVSVVDPSGDVRYDRTFTGSSELRGTQDAVSWEAEAGEWTLARTYAGAIGHLEFEAWAAHAAP